jgi:hypothetical protein
MSQDNRTAVFLEEELPVVAMAAVVGLLLMEMTVLLLLAPNVPVMITHPETVLPVEKGKVALVAPFANATVAGTVNAGLLLVSATVDTPTFALVSWTAQIPEPPGITFDGVQLTPEMAAAAERTIEKVFEVPFNDAVMLVVAFVEINPACTANVTEDEPKGTWRAVVGTTSMGFPLDREITARLPPASASVKATVQVVDAAEVSRPDWHVIEEIPSTCNAIVVLAVVPFNVAVSVAVWSAAIIPVVTLNITVVALVAASTDAGAVNTGDPLFPTVTSAPPAGAPCDSMTVHIALPFELNAVAVHVSPLTVVGACSAIVVLTVVPFNVAASVAVWLIVSVPVVTLNVAVATFAATGTDAGAVNAGDPLFPTVTNTPPAGAACDSVTVHDALPFELNVAAVHVSPFMVADTCSAIVVLAVVPLNVPVSVAAWFAVIVPVVTVNVALVAFAVTVTDAGAVNAGDPLLPSVTTAPPAGAACDSVIVHDAVPFELSEVAVHVSPLMVGIVVILAVPPLAESGSPSPATDALIGAPTLIAALLAPAANATDTVAITPFGIVSVVFPLIRQMSAWKFPLQMRDLLAAASIGPGDTVKLVTAVLG